MNLERENAQLEKELQRLLKQKNAHVRLMCLCLYMILISIVLKLREAISGLQRELDNLDDKFGKVLSGDTVSCTCSPSCLHNAVAWRAICSELITRGIRHRDPTIKRACLKKIHQK